MQDSFALLCVPWYSRAAMLVELRKTACENGLLSREDAKTDMADEQSNHALILSESGEPLGCARITSDGKTERMVVLPLGNRAEIESALRLVAWLN